jgi:hypothetical protein
LWERNIVLATRNIDLSPWEALRDATRATMEVLGRFIGMEMDEPVIADHLQAIQSTYDKRTSKPPVNEVREMVASGRASHR